MLISSAFQSFSSVSNAASAATTTTFGNTTVGGLTNFAGKDMDASRFQLSLNGDVQSLTVYFEKSGFNAKTAIYSDSNGAPGNLITQSSSQRISSTGWTTFAVPQKSLPAGYYWLTFVCDRSTATVRMTTTSDNSHNWKQVTYSNMFTSTFGTPSGTEATSSKHITLL